MFLEANSSHPIAVIKFVSSYDGKKFFVYDASSNGLYYGVFGSSNGDDDDRYTMTKVDNYGQNGQIIIKPSN